MDGKFWRTNWLSSSWHLTSNYAISRKRKFTTYLHYIICTSYTNVDLQNLSNKVDYLRQAMWKGECSKWLIKGWQEPHNSKDVSNMEWASDECDTKMINRISTILKSFQLVTFMILTHICCITSFSIFQFKRTTWYFANYIIRCQMIHFWKSWKVHSETDNHYVTIRR